MSSSSSFSALAHFKLLEAQLKLGASASKEIINACRSQAGLASLSIPKYHVKPTSLNTLKAAADRQTELGGWTGLDNLRKELLRRNRNGTISKEQRRPATEVKKEETEILASEAHRVRLRLERAYLDLLAIAKSSASHDEQLRNELERHQATWGVALGLSLAQQSK